MKHIQIFNDFIYESRVIPIGVLNKEQKEKLKKSKKDFNEKRIKKIETEAEKKGWDTKENLYDFLKRTKVKVESPAITLKYGNSLFFIKRHRK